MALLLVASGIFGILDVVGTSAFLAHGNHWDHLVDSLRDKSVSTTGFDFFLVSILRCSLLFGGLIGVLYNPHTAKKRIAATSIYVTVCAVCSTLYIFTKLLIYSEQPEFLESGLVVVWFWASFGWFILATAVTTIFFSKLSVVVGGSLQVTFGALGNFFTGERERLLGDKVSINDADATTENASSNGTSMPSCSDDGDMDNEKNSNNNNENKKSLSENKVTFTKMLSYSKDDAWLLSFTVFFLLGAAVGETFIPLFTGKVISGKRTIETPSVRTRLSAFVAVVKKWCLERKSACK